MLYRIVNTSSGLPTLEVENEGRRIFIHSRIDPAREAQVYAERYDPSRFDVLIVLGAGLGYHLLPLQNMLDEYRTVIVIDPMAGIENEIERNEKTSFIATSGAITLMTGKTAEEVSSILPGMIDLDNARGIAVIEHNVSVKFHGQYFSAIRKTIESAVNISAGNLATVRAFGGRYLKNALINACRLDGMIPVDAIRGMFREFTAVLAVPGVSLEALIPRIIGRRNECIVIAVDSALPVLMGYGLDADFVVSIDPQPYINEHYLATSGSNAIPVCTLTAHHARVRLAPAIVALNSHPVCQLLSESGALSIGSIESGTGTVAGDALMLCYLAGFGRIGLAGLDFCFTDRSIYARGTAYQRRYSTIFNSRLKTADSFNFEYIRNSSRDYSVGKISTRRSFVRYRDLTVRLIAERPHDGTIVARLSEGGLPLAGVQTVAPDDFFGVTGNPPVPKERIMKSILNGKRIDGRGVEKYMKAAVRGPEFVELCRASLGRKASRDEILRYQRIVLDER